MTATSTEQRTESSCAFLNRPPLRLRKVLNDDVSIAWSAKIAVVFYVKRLGAKIGHRCRDRQYMKADRGSRIQSATGKSSASTHTERFRSSLMALISIFRRPIVVIFGCYVCRGRHLRTRLARPESVGGLLERKWRVSRWAGRERTPFSIVMALQRQSDRGVDQYYGLSYGGIMIRRSGITIQHISFPACTFDIQRGLREVLNLNRRKADFPSKRKSFGAIHGKFSLIMDLF